MRQLAAILDGEGVAEGVFKRRPKIRSVPLILVAHLGGEDHHGEVCSRPEEFAKRMVAESFAKFAA